MDQVVHRVLRFERFSLDLTRGCARVGDQDLNLRPKAFEVLRYLAENAGRLVSKHELSQVVWPSVFVSDDSLVQCIRELRDRLGDQDHRLIKTLPRRGYLLDAVLLRADAEVPHDSGRSLSRPADEMAGSRALAARLRRAVFNSRRLLVGAGLALVGLVSVAAISGLGPERRQPDQVIGRVAQPMLAIMPFANLSADPEHDFLADGVTEELITSLSRRSRGMVIARSTAFTYKGKSIDVRELGRELGIRYVLEGAVARSGEGLRITAQLADAAAATTVWADSFDAARSDFSIVRDEVVVRLARALRIELASFETARSARERRNSPDAFELNMRAWLKLYRTPKGGDLTEARVLFREAIRLDDGIADAWAGLARTYIRNVRFSQSREQDLKAASDAVERALVLDRNNATAHLVKGLVLYEQGRIERALLELEYAAELDPGEPTVRASIAAANVMLGRPEAALGPLRDAMRLSPKDPELATWQMFLGVAYLHLARIDEALHWLNRSVALNPSDQFTQLFLASALGLSGRKSDAAIAVGELLRLRPGFTLSNFKALEPSNAPEFRAQRERVYEGLRRAGLPE